MPEARPLPEPATAAPPPPPAAEKPADPPPKRVATPIVSESREAGEAVDQASASTKHAALAISTPREPLRRLLLLSLVLMALGSLLYLASMLIGLGLGTTSLLAGYYLNMAPWILISAVLLILWQWPAVTAASRGSGPRLGWMIAAPFTGLAAARRAGASETPGNASLVIAFACLGTSGLLYWIFFLGMGNAAIGLLRMVLRLVGATMLAWIVLKARPAPGRIGSPTPPPPAPPARS